MTTPDIGFVEEIARAAGAVLLKHFGALERVEKKGARDLVTAADREAEELIIARIRERFPDDGILAEETANDETRAPRMWIIDPLDGTTNFVHRIPHVAVSIAWCLDGVPVVACVHNPVLDHCYTAVRGGGAFLNGAPISATETAELSEAVLATGFHYHRESQPDSNLQHFVDFGYQVRGLRRLGSAACDLCYVADGRFDGYWELWLSPWDVAAGGLIAREAGCVVCDFDGNDDWLFGRRIVAANRRLAERIRAVIREADPALLPGPQWKGEGPA